MGLDFECVHEPAMFKCFNSVTPFQSLAGTSGDRQLRPDSSAGAAAVHRAEFACFSPGRAQAAVGALQIRLYGASNKTSSCPV